MGKMAILACPVSLLVQIAQSPLSAWLVHSILGRQTGVCKSVGFTPSRIKFKKLPGSKVW